MERIKIALTALFLTLAAGIFFPLFSEGIYPGTNAIFTFGIIFITCIGITGKDTKHIHHYYILIIAVLSTAYRLRIFLYPASLIGMDPDGYAIQIARVVENGDISAITYGFYSSAPLHFLNGVLSVLIANIPSPTAVIIYPVVNGAIVPLLAASFVRLIRPRSPKSIVLAAGLASVLGYTVEYSYAPVAQSTGVLLVVLAIFTIHTYASNGGYRWLFLGLLTMIAAVYTHKLSAVAITLSVTGAVLLGLLHPATRSTSELKRLGGSTVCILGLITGIQLMYVTRFLSPIVYFLAIPETVTPTVTEIPTAAIDPYTFTDRLFRYFYIIFLGALSGYVWLKCFWESTRERTDPVFVLYLGLVAPLASLIILLYPFGVSPTRTIFYSELFLAILIVVGLYWTNVESISLTTNLRKFSAITVIILLALTAGVSPIAGPDWDGSYREYLTSEEVEAKEWGYEMVPSEIITDQYYASETPPERITSISGIQNQKSTKFISRSNLYLDNRFGEIYPPSIAYRSCIDTLRSSFGIWRLTYDLDKVLNNNYNRVYDSGCVSYFSPDRD